MPDSNIVPLLYIISANIKGYKSIEDLSVELKPGMNIIIGKNGAGKSNFMEALYNAMLSIYSTKEITFRSSQLLLKSYNGEELLYSIERQNLKHVLSSQFDEDLYMQKLELNGKVVYNSSNDEAVTFEHNGRKYPMVKNIRGIFHRLKIPILIPNFVKFAIPDDIAGVMTPTSIRIPVEYDEPWEMDSRSGFLQSAAQTLEDRFSSPLLDMGPITSAKLQAEWARRLAEITPDQVISNMLLSEEVLINLKKFSPIEDLRINENITFYEDNSYLIADNIRLDFYINGSWLPWSQLSDGTRRLFFIISDISLSGHGTILMEEPELGVHPHQFDLVMQFLKEQSISKQIIVSTHSPKAIDILSSKQLDAILIASYHKGKGTKLARMAEGQKRKALDYMESVGFLSDYWLMSDLEQ
ncbi:AAA family ATPase [Pedobacter sp. MC2016-05]|uniref:AAA family ATPase n=1 Tax=Pedobacter sp. MC2016-05 TaxID=2994474 RepID=UPI0022457AC1|nr:ATP-binding protein [Pedobacter sp. MC2016-05]MCX2476078.1 AAA family ATPase [Pedobacter sp. MC2016-05]